MRTASIVIMVVGLFLGRGYMGGLLMGPWLATKIASHESPKIPSDFPNDVPVYPNFQLEEAQKYAGAHMLELTARSDAQTVLTFYRQQIGSLRLAGQSHYSRRNRRRRRLGDHGHQGRTRGGLG